MKHPSDNKKSRLRTALAWAGLATISILAPTSYGTDGKSLSWQTITSAEDVYQAYPDLMNHLLEALDLNRPGLEAVKAACTKGESVSALNALLNYYQTSSSGHWLRLEPVEPTTQRSAEADEILNDEITFDLAKARMPRTEDGRLRWDYRSPNNDREWAWNLNRHYHLWILFDAYRQTGNPVYLERIDQDLRDWIVSSLPYPAKHNSAHDWRGLEVHHRAHRWAIFFYGCMKNPELRPATRLLMLASLVDHAHYLRHFHAGTGNWITMELSALCYLGAAWPEYKESDAWVKYSVATLNRQITSQVYPDGVQMELTSGYHYVTLNNFEKILLLNDHVDLGLPPTYAQNVQKMWNYLAWTMRPDGYGLLNNDCDREYLTPRIIDAAKRYQRSDWQYIATHGQCGDAPAAPPSRIFPWSGHLIMRSGWDKDALWAFFDIGPWGTGHQHNDKLHLSVAAFGRDLLVDSGIFSYSGLVAERFRAYARSSAGHNVILIDGCGQKGGPRKTDTPLPQQDYAVEPEFDFGKGSFSDFADIAGSAEHTRAVKFLRGKYWVVVDKITTDRPRDIQVLWHFHPDCTVQTQNNVVFTADADKGNLRLQPIGSISWQVQIVKGQEKPQMQGWYSPQYNNFTPAPTALYNAHIDQTSIFCWLLLPGKGPVPPAEVEILKITPQAIILGITHAGDTQNVQIPLD